ncbi:MAG: hypothetical protein LBB81_00790 [Treponema sp.]|jgi:hypothetical protein|nr:hypothetical protein [Treponema sp.]
MRYADKEAQKAFSGKENYDRPLALLEESFRAAGHDIEFVCVIGADKAKIVSIFRGGFLDKQQSIECDSPACAVKDVAAAVRL